MTEGQRGVRARKKERSVDWRTARIEDCRKAKKVNWRTARSEGQ
jgi:hypothetical protein